MPRMALNVVPMENAYVIVNYCGTCCKTDCSLTSIDVEDSDNVKIIYKLITCVSEIAWDKDRITSLICDDCIEKLRVSFDFRNNCIAANHTLLLRLKEINNDNNKDTTLNRNRNIVKHGAVKNLIETPEETGDNSTYTLHLKHFLDSEEDFKNDNSELTADNSLAPRSDISTNSIADGDYIDNYNQTESIEIQNFDHIIVETKSNQTKDQSKYDNAKEDHRPAAAAVVRNEGNQLVADLNNSGQPHMELIENDDNQENSNGNSRQDTVIATLEIHDFSLNLEKEPIIKQQQQRKTVAVQIKKQKETGSNNNSNNSVNTCQQCGKSYRKKASLKIHMRSHTGEKPFECKYCERRFYHSSHLKEHIRRHKGETPYHCLLCTKKFTIKGELTMHMKSHTGEKPFPCDICDRRCLTSSDLKIHMRTHTGEKPYKCETCGKQFRSKYILTSHIKTHTGERPHACKICDKTFTQSSHLNVHMRKHTGEKVICKCCSASFNHSSQLTVHMRKHTGKQPYKCDVCDKLCNYASELQIHMVKHTGEKFSCTICQKQFATAAYLTEHIRHHTGENLFNCSICDRHFTRRQYLEKHVRTHTGEKPFFCNICEKQFTQSSSLKVHTRIHTGEKPYQCEICDKKFTTSSDLAVHIRKHTE